MRTSIFNEFADLPKEFREDFETLWSLPREEREALIPYISTVCKSQTVGEKEEAMDKAITEIGGNAASLLRALKFLVYVYREWNPIQDTPEGFIKDLLELGLVPSDKGEEARVFLVNFLGEVQKDNRRRLEKMYANSTIPSLIGAMTLIDFRAIIDKPFGSSIRNKLEEYKPTCISFAPVILVKIRTTDQENDGVFQCDENDIRILIRQLEAALKDLEAARKSLPGGLSG